MNIFKVGGCVRDHLMNLPSNDTDYVVVGSTPEEMKSLGFEQVGADFPVFLHPDTKDEYALARTERKSGPGYNGFVTDFKSVNSLNPVLLGKLNFVGFESDKKYEISDLMEAFHCINQSS